MEATGDSASPGRRAARKEARRKAIVAVATRSFLDLGYAATTMTAIAAALGGSKATLWSYFPSKEDLFAAVIEAASNRMRADVYPALDAAGPLEATLRAFCLGFLTSITAPDGMALYRLVVGESGRFPEVGRLFYERAARHTLEALANFLAHHMAAGSLRPDDPAGAAAALIGLCQAGGYRDLLWRSLPPDQAVLDRDAAFATAAFLAAYGLRSRCS
jgi:AcrR family transcriptional regulator